MACGLLLCGVRTEREELAHGALLDTIQAGGLEENWGWRATIVKRPCLNELQKEYCVKIKLIALD